MKGIVFIRAAVIAMIGTTTIGFLFGYSQERIHRDPVSSGRYLSPAGTSMSIGSFPCAMAISPDGNFIAVTDSGFRESLSVIDAKSGNLIQSLNYSDPKDGKLGLYYGLRYRTVGGTLHLLASLGENKVASYLVADDGTLEANPAIFTFDHGLVVGPAAGIDLASDPSEFAVAINGTTLKFPHKGRVEFVNIQTGKETASTDVPGYPLDVLTLGQKTFVSCERDGVVAVLQNHKLVATIKVGANPTKLLGTQDGTLLYVANSGSDTVSEISTKTNSVLRTILVRPAAMHGLLGATPLGLAILPNDGLAVALGDLNAVAILDLRTGQVKGMVPTGWYPTAVAASGDESNMFVASAKGIEARTPNSGPMGPNGKWGQYVLNDLDGTVSMITTDFINQNMVSLSNQVIQNAHLDQLQRAITFKNPGIKHVIYIVKENRTYDQVFGDLSQGNGDSKICLFGKDITPNEHALASRFGLYDNFYTCADVSADGWNWSTSGMINEYTARNAPNSYSGRRSGYDYEGQNSDYNPSLEGQNDVAKAPCGYLWEQALKQRKTVRSFGFFVDFIDKYDADKKPLPQVSEQKSLLHRTDGDFRRFDLDYSDSDLWLKEHFTSKDQMRSYGSHHDPSRFDAWKRDFEQDVKNKSLPELSLMRLPNDHTAGTKPGHYTPSAMVADNDYALGQIVEEVSHSPYWHSTLICVLEDDSQDGYDHVDCHRSTALLISPYLERGRVDHEFLNTDSMLHTIELVLGLKPMNSYDASASVFLGFRNLQNFEPYRAILPSKAIASALNTPKSYKAQLSEKIVDRFGEHTGEDLALNDILWGAVKGMVPRPKIVRSPIPDKD